MKNIIDFSNKTQNTAEAARWLLKLESGAISVSEKRQLSNWLERNPDNIDHLKRLANVWSDANILTELAVTISQPISIFRSQWVAVAASLFIMIGIATFFYFDKFTPPQQNVVIVTEVGVQKSSTLADGSIVKLNTDSRVRIDYSDGFRDVFLLNGEAHFIVASNKDRPFRVYAANGRIHAIGTEFSVYLKKGEIDVTVSEGRVGIASFEIQVPSNAISTQQIDERPIKSLGMLRAGEVGTIVGRSAESEEAILKIMDQVTDVDIEKRISWTNGVLIFAGEPLEEVVREISRYTEVNIEFSDPGLKRIRIGGTFPVGETEAMFSALETSFGLQVIRLDSKNIIISDTKEL